MDGIAQKIERALLQDYLDENDTEVDANGHFSIYMDGKYQILDTQITYGITGKYKNIEVENRALAYNICLALLGQSTPEYDGISKETEREMNLFRLKGSIAYVNGVLVKRENYEEAKHLKLSNEVRPQSADYVEFAVCLSKAKKNSDASVDCGQYEMWYDETNASSIMSHMALSQMKLKEKSGWGASLAKLVGYGAKESPRKEDIPESTQTPGAAVPEYETAIPVETGTSDEKKEVSETDDDDDLPLRYENASDEKPEAVSESNTIRYSTPLHFETPDESPKVKSVSQFTKLPEFVTRTKPRNMTLVNSNVGGVNILFPDFKEKTSVFSKLDKAKIGTWAILKPPNGPLQRYFQHVLGTTNYIRIEDAKRVRLYIRDNATKITDYNKLLYDDGLATYVLRVPRDYRPKQSGV